MRIQPVTGICRAPGPDARLAVEKRQAGCIHQVKVRQKWPWIYLIGRVTVRKTKESKNQGFLEKHILR
jgi:hypothetical protein